MSKIVFFIILGGLVIVASATININDVQAREQAEFIQISVLSEDQADYGMDESFITIPAVSMEIIEDKIHDDGEALSSLPVITFISKSPATDPKPADKDSDDSEFADHPPTLQGQDGDENGNTSQDDKDKDKDGNGNSNANKDDQDKDNNGNGNANNGNSDKKENKPDKAK